MTPVCSLKQTGAFQPRYSGGVSVITSLLVSYDREAAAYVQSFGLKAVAVVSNGLKTSGHQRGHLWWLYFFKWRILCNHSSASKI